MPKYEVITKQVIERSYDWEVNLPVDMGSAHDRLCDRSARQAAEDGQLENIVSMKEAVSTDDETREVVAYVFRDGKQIWPRLRKGQVPKLTEQRPVIQKLGEKETETIETPMGPAKISFDNPPED